MRLFFFITGLIVSIIYISGCNKNSTGFTACTNLPVTSDSAALLHFARMNNITPSLDTTGLYYQILDSGQGASPLPTSKIFVSYTATFLNGTIFDSTTNFTNTGYVLNSLIEGWQIGLSKIKTGGRIKLLIPSALAYCCGGSGTTVPSNTPIFFDVTLYYIQ